MPSTLALVVSAALALGAMGFSVGLFAWTAYRAAPRCRAYAERRFGVTLGTGHRGYWKVTSGPGSAWRHLLIELLQPAVFMGAIIVWSAAVLVTLGLMEVAGRFL